MNAKGEVIGINTVKVNADAVEGMGYAIPISDVTDVINDLMNRQTRTKDDESERGAQLVSAVQMWTHRVLRCTICRKVCLFPT